MRVLLDTHVFLWLQVEPERLGSQLALVQDAETELLLSAASAWEIAIKYALGRLPLPEPPRRYVPSRLASTGARALSVDAEHALGVAELPLLHRDPFDRLLIAQGVHEDIPIMTADPHIGRYGCQVLLVG